MGTFFAPSAQCLKRKHSVEEEEEEKITLDRTPRFIASFPPFTSKTAAASWPAGLLLPRLSLAHVAKDSSAPPRPQLKWGRQPQLLRLTCPAKPLSRLLSVRGGSERRDLKGRSSFKKQSEDFISKKLVTLPLTFSPFKKTFWPPGEGCGRLYAF